MTLQIDVSGSGPDLVLLHGWGMNAAVWSEVTCCALARFLALQARGEAHPRVVLRRLREHVLTHGAPDVAALRAGLQLLKETDLRDRLQRIAQPALLLHGECDTLVPLVAAQYLQRTLPHATREVFAGIAHARPSAEPQRSARRIVEFCRAS